MHGVAGVITGSLIFSIPSKNRQFLIIRVPFSLLFEYTYDTALPSFSVSNLYFRYSFSQKASFSVSESSMPTVNHIQTITHSTLIQFTGNFKIELPVESQIQVKKMSSYKSTESERNDLNIGIGARVKELRDEGVR